MLKHGRLQSLILVVFITVLCFIVLFTSIVYHNLNINYNRSDKKKSSLSILHFLEDMKDRVMEIEHYNTIHELTHNEYYLRKYRVAVNKYPHDVAALQKVKIYDRQEQKQLDALPVYISSFIDITNSILQQKEHDKRIALISEEHETVDKIDGLIKEIENKEREKLKKIDSLQKSEHQNTVILFVVFSLVLSVFMFFAYFFIRKALAFKYEVQKKLAETLGSFSAMFYKSPVNKIMANLETGKIVMVNDAYLQMGGFVKEELLGKKLAEVCSFVYPTERDSLMAVVEKEGSVRHKEIQAKTKQGRVIWLSISAEIIWHQNQRCVLIASIDITQQKEDAQKLIESQKLFSAIFYKSPVAFAISNTRTAEIIDANEVFGSFFGYSREEVIGQSATTLKLWHREQDRTDTLHHLRNKKRENVEIKMNHKSGLVKDIMANGDLLELNGEEYLISAFVDIGRRKAAERELQILNNSLEQKVLERTKKITDYQNALDVSTIISIFDKDFNLTYLNDNFCKVSGWKREELIGRNTGTFKVKVASFDSIKSFNTFLAQGNVWQGEVETKSKTNQPYWMYTTIVPFTNDLNETYQYLSISFDISATKKVQAELEHTLHELENLSDLLNEAQSIAHIGSWESNLLTGKDTWSDEFYNILGTKKGEIIPSYENFLKFIHPEDVHLAQQECFTKEKRTEKLQFYTRIVLQDGSVKHVFNEIRAIYDEHYNVLRLNGVIIDKTEEQKTQTEKAKITADLIRRNSSLEKFAHIVSHNLRAPLANIIGLSSIVSVSELEEEERMDALSLLTLSVSRLDEVVKDLTSILNMHSIAHGQYERVLLDEVVSLVCDKMKYKIDEQKAVIHTDFTVQNEVISIGNHLVYCIRALISNAIKFRKPQESPVITITSCKTSEGVTISVKDNGKGMDLSQFGNKIFGLYNKHDINEDGKGMGLFMARSLIESMEGEIAVESTPGEGSVFHIFLKSNLQENDFPQKRFVAVL